MKVGSGIVVRSVTDTLKAVCERRPNITYKHVLEALEYLRYTITEEAIVQDTPELRRYKQGQRK